MPIWAGREVSRASCRLLWSSRQRDNRIWFASLGRRSIATRTGFQMSTLDAMPFHSFPRRADTESEAVDKGLAILSSIVEMGLLLVPERIEWSELLADGSRSDPPWELFQKRISFSDISEDELEAHSELFGPFALEYSPEALRRLGGVPVFYVPLESAEEGLEGMAAAMLARLGEVQRLLGRLHEVHEYASGLKSHQAMTLELNGRPVGSVRAGDVRLMLDVSTSDTQPLDALKASVVGFSGFFYPVENLDYTDELFYYQQREWRITGNMASQGVPTTRELTGDEKDLLLTIDESFFSCIEDYPSGTLRKVDQCQVMTEFGGKHALSHADRLIVPRGTESQAAEALSDANLDLSITVTPAR